MPEATRDGRPNGGGGAASGERELMDLDLDLDASSWPFDPIAAFVSSPQSLLHLSSFPPPPSPLWLFEDRAVDFSALLSDFPRPVPGNCNTANGFVVQEEGQTRSQQNHVTEENFLGAYVLKQRMSQALRYFKEWTDQHVLVQIWAPVKNGDKHVLITSGQPFVLDPHSTKLLQYRMASVSYTFSVDEENDGDLGLPGRVFKQKLPEWSPNVQYYSSKEYPRLNHALNNDVQGTLALPVFEPSGQSCVGVVELVLTSSKIHYAPEVDKVCKALEAVNLKSSEILDYATVQICNEGRQAALSEILEILTVVCEEHKLPLAQTWVPCQHRSVLAQGGGLRKICSSFDGSCNGQVCMSTTDVALYVIDPHMWGFRDACVEHHLQKGQGVAGRAFELRRPCFCRDITLFRKTEYPLVHYARMFELVSCLAICLQSTQSGNDDYILEFFLPAECTDTNEQQVLLESISAMMKQCFRNLKVLSGLDLHEGMSLEVIDLLANANHGMDSKPTCSQNSDPDSHSSPETNNPEVLEDHQNERHAGPDSRELNLAFDANTEKNGNGASSPVPGDKNNGILQRRRGKAEKTISLEVLQQYFAGSLKDAAKSLGVCPTTMKRICRQHGISRWPSRKINKVNRSLTKLKRVIESVQGAEGAFNLTSLTCPLPSPTGSISWPITQCKAAARDKDSPKKITARPDYRDKKFVLQEEPAFYETASQLEHVKESDCSKTRISSDGSLDTPSPGLCHESPPQETPVDNPFSSPKLGADIFTSFGLTSQLVGGHSTPHFCSSPEANTPELVSPLGGMLVEDSGSSKDLRNLCGFAGEGCQDEFAIPPHCASTLEPRIVTIKACYKEDIIRFRLTCNAGVVALNDEVAKRLKLEVGTFDIKYLDDDHEWVTVSCDADLEECMEVSKLSGGQLIRLTVQDIIANLGSSCESCGE